MNAPDKTIEETRANLEADAASLNLIEFWKQRRALEPQQPKSTAVPHAWRWDDVHPRLIAAGETVPIEECERRALVFSNPGLQGKPHVTENLFAAFSLYKAGETAPVHRHTPSASRFVVEGTGGYTIVEGEKCQMGRGDLILTPAGCWHDHGNEGTESLIWMDVLDLNMVNAMHINYFEFDFGNAKADMTGDHPLSTGYQEVAAPADNSQKLYGVGGMLPLFGESARGMTGNHSPQFVFRWERAREALEKLAEYEGSAYDGVIMEYVNPITGGSVMPTLSFRVQMLRPGEKTLARRKLSSTVFFGLEGSGTMEVDGESIAWGRNDVMSLPIWREASFHNTSSENTFLYSVTDEPLVTSMGLYREQRRLENGDLEMIVRGVRGDKVIHS